MCNNQNTPQVNTSGERLGKKIRNAEKAKIPVMSVIGDKEVEAESLNIRTRVSGELGATPIAEVLEKLGDAIATYSAF
ncbi:Threonine--tRNA ligase [Acaryochloris thomasi RCC1774]|uniref:Threonine--tRNA ligase n=1 Tax=Acaryochloris thomasi RCC1774 TaxID=1764569 RepID=A0A2W1K7G3_9CYAN|nr:Threonine--tRNA ligase [Acaryochloris thomasi RCC1774]